MSIFQGRCSCVWAYPMFFVPRWYFCCSYIHGINHCTNINRNTLAINGRVDWSSLVYYSIPLEYCQSQVNLIGRRRRDIRRWHRRLEAGCALIIFRAWAGIPPRANSRHQFGQDSASFRCESYSLPAPSSHGPVTECW